MTPTSLPHSTAAIVEALLPAESRLLILGKPGSGKSTLAASIASELAAAERPCLCIGADPGSPAFGVPGAVCRGRWSEEGWRLEDFEPLCSLDAARFRLPLADGVRRLAARAPRRPLLVDAPGVLRGVAGSELVSALCEASGAESLLLLAGGEAAPELLQTLSALPVRVVMVPCHPAARRPNKRELARRRSRLWQAWLEDARTRTLELSSLSLIGTPPPVTLPEIWAGRQAAFCDERGATALGEVVTHDGAALTLRLPRATDAARGSLLLRDAGRGPDGLLQTLGRPTRPRGARATAPDMVPHPAWDDRPPLRLEVRLGPLTATLVNGVFGDPLLHLRFRHERRSLLFDMGEAARLPARICHQVSDVFVSHAHFDHIAGFLWLARSRIGEPSCCRLFGPPGLLRHVRGLLSGIHWDRIGSRGPRFQVAELDGVVLRRWSIQAGLDEARPLDETKAAQGLLLEEPEFRVRATTLDHGIPVLAFAFEPGRQLNVRKDRLQALGLEPGPWLGRLKRQVQRDDLDAEVSLPDGSRQPARELAQRLIAVTPGRKLVYATDLADTPANRERLVWLARGARTFFCEAGFTASEADQARATGHLTARACGEIAAAAGVHRLLPFHFSRRYESEPEAVYREVLAAFPGTELPHGVRLGLRLETKTRSGGSP